ncbi:MAG: hypothetical protein AB2806_02445 [Candidatus Thiodiazotropha sp.]
MGNLKNPLPNTFLISGIIIATTGYLIGPRFWGVIVVVILRIELWHKLRYGRGFFSKFP